LIDRHFLGPSLGTLGSDVGIIMSPMVPEHIPRVVDIARLSGERGFIVRETVRGPLAEYGGTAILEPTGGHDAPRDERLAALVARGIG
jgi:hypothetical protein